MQRITFELRFGSGHWENAGSSMTSVGWPAKRTSRARRRSLDTAGLSDGSEPGAVRDAAAAKGFAS